MATSNVASPNLSEFKSYWSARETDSKKRTKQNKDKDSDDEDDLVPFAALKERTRMKGPTGGGDKSPALQVPLHRPDNVSNDEQWESVLQAGKKKCAEDLHSRQVELATRHFT